MYRTLPFHHLQLSLRRLERRQHEIANVARRLVEVEAHFLLFERQYISCKRVRTPAQGSKSARLTEPKPLDTTLN